MESTSTLPSPYLLQDNLHFKPISARWGISMLNFSTELAKPYEGDENASMWLSKTVLVVGGVLSGFLATIEAVAVGTFAVLGIVFSFCISSEFLEKHSLKALSFSIHSVFILIASIIAIRHLKISTSYRNNVFFNHALYLGAAALAQLVVGGIFDSRKRRIRDEDEQKRICLQRIGYAVIDDLPDFVGDFSRGWLLDSPLPTLLPGLLEGEFNALIPNFIRQIQDWVPSLRNWIPAAGTDNDREFEINRSSEPVRTYQGHLQNFIEQSVRDIFQNDALVEAFAEQGADNRAASGREALEGFSPNCFPFIANWAQLKEIEQTETHCPEDLDPRRQQIIAARRAYAQLNGPERILLQDKLLRGGDYSPENSGVDEPRMGELQQLYREITTLSAELVQGPLVTRTVIDFSALNGEDGAEFLSSHNIFQEAYRRGLETGH